ncbi:unnamed protein product [Brassica rapa subsp. narinosa]
MKNHTFVLKLDPEYVIRKVNRCTLKFLNKKILLIRTFYIQRP